MKNIFAIAFLFMFANCAFAQESEQKNPLVLAKQELNELIKVIEIDNEKVININDLLIYKHEMTLKYPERKEELAKTMEEKLKGILTPDEFKKIKGNKKLFKDLLY